MIELLNMDCMEYMATCKDKQFDLAIVDPPYGIGSWTSQGSKHGKVKWNNSIPHKDYFTEVIRISERQIIWGANYYNCFSDKGGCLVWYKGESTKTLSGCELASLSFQKKVDYVHINWQAGFFREMMEGEQIHPCQKPISLYKWLLKNYAKEGDKIFDSHLGSGSIAIACHDMGFDLVGTEIDKDYFEAMTKRFYNHKSQLKLAI